MKKNGFTLSEALIALVVIGVIAAVVAPMANKLKPDLNKAMYIKTYDNLVQIMNSMVNNTILFPWQSSEDDTINYSKGPLYNKEAVTYDDIEFSSGNSKFCQILAYSLNSDHTTCDTSYTPKKPRFDFTTPNGIQFSVDTIQGKFTEKIMVENSLQLWSSWKYKNYILFDVNGDDLPNCIGNTKQDVQTTCPKPDRFAFWVTPDGHLIAADVAGQYYLKNRDSFNSKDIIFKDNDGLEYVDSSIHTTSDWFKKTVPQDPKMEQVLEEDVWDRLTEGEFELSADLKAWSGEVNWEDILQSAKPVGTK